MSGFLDYIVQGEELQGEPGSLIEIRRKTSEFGEVEAAGICGASYPRERRYAKNRTV